MMTHACLVAVLIGASVGGAAGPPFPEDRDLLISSNHALMDIEQLCVVVATRETEGGEPWVDVEKLKGQVVEKLVEGGLGHKERETGPTPRLVAHVEGMVVPDSDRYVYRVQLSVNRLVTFSARRDLQVQAEVWHLRPVMAVVAAADAQEAIARTVLTQAEVFVGVCNAARSLRDWAQVRPQGVLSSVKARPQNLQAMTGYPFVASRNSPVFHRADCRWAQNISEGNRVGYESREEAIRAGKRPCKTCKP